VSSAREKAERDQVRAKKAEEAAERKAQRDCDKQAREAEKAVQLPQRGKRKASQSAAPRKKQNHGVGVARTDTVARLCERIKMPQPRDSKLVTCPSILRDQDFPIARYPNFFIPGRDVYAFFMIKGGVALDVGNPLAIAWLNKSRSSTSF
jgi:hypothetical protein